MLPSARMLENVMEMIGKRYGYIGESQGRQVCVGEKSFNAINNDNVLPNHSNIVLPLPFSLLSPLYLFLVHLKAGMLRGVVGCNTAPAKLSK